MEFHHVKPYAAGGTATEENIELRCRAHNAYEGRLFFESDIVREDSAWWTRADGGTRILAPICRSLPFLRKD